MTYEEPPHDLVLAALADPTRRAILESLRERPSSVAALARSRPVSRPAVSQHLKVLAEAGLVEAEPRGASRIYRVRPDGLAALKRYLESFWGDALAAFASEAETEGEPE